MKINKGVADFKERTITVKEIPRCYGCREWLKHNQYILWCKDGGYMWCERCIDHDRNMTTTRKYLKLSHPGDHIRNSFDGHEDFRMTLKDKNEVKQDGK